MSVWEENWTPGALDVDAGRRLRLSALLGRLEAVSIAHATALGVGREKTLDRGLLWAVSRVRAEFSRVPRYDEPLVLSTWPGETMHTLFPRYYELRDGRGERLARASSLWLLMDARTRKMAFPGEWGIEVPGCARGDEPELPGPVAPFEGQSSLRTVLCSETDLNGHMNNGRYADWADDLAGGAYLLARTLRLAEINYQRELAEGAEVTLRCLLSPDRLLVSGYEGNVRAFALRETFSEE